VIKLNTTHPFPVDGGGFGIRFAKECLSPSSFKGYNCGPREQTVHASVSGQEQHMEPQLAEVQRKEIFEALVDAQDHEMTVAQSRQVIAQRFGVTESLVRQIEREGLDRLWPPL
jgi:hypothetical protein